MLTAPCCSVQYTSNNTVYARAQFDTTVFHIYIQLLLTVKLSAFRLKVLGITCTILLCNLYKAKILIGLDL